MVDVRLRISLRVETEGAEDVVNPRDRFSDVPSASFWIRDCDYVRHAVSPVRGLFALVSLPWSDYSMLKLFSKLNFTDSLLLAKNEQ
jgi:hypothetical protein